MKRTTLIAIAAIAIQTLTTAIHAGEKDIVDTAIAAGKFNTLATALTKAELIDTLRGDGPYTVFAPTDEAFANLPKETLETLLKPENKSQLQAILTYHVVAGKVLAKDVVKLNVADTVNGQRVNISVDHGVKVNDAKVIKTDIMCSNGVIHVIDSVILPSNKNIIETAIAAGSFKTLSKALQAADLVEALQGEGPFTVFAPTDEAFAKLPKETLNSLLKPENKENLAAILKYHVVAGRVYSDQAVKAGSAKTLQGDQVKISAKNGKGMINDAGLVKTDIDATNGVIHVIDSVIMPPSSTMIGLSSPSELIELAIERGVPLFNHGNEGACADVYEVTIRSLLVLGNETLTEHDRERLGRGLHQMNMVHGDNAKAWALRNALDDVYESLRRTAGDNQQMKPMRLANRQR